MQTIINIFTIIGSIIGIIAFFLSILSSLKDYNLRKWEKVTKIINIIELEEFRKGAGNGIIYKENYLKLKDLVFFIRNRSDDIEFKGFLKNRIQNKFIQIKELYDEISKEVQVPKWEVWGKSEHIEFILDKDYIYQKTNSQEEGDRIVYESMDIVQDKANKIIELYREIFSLSNRLPLEYLYKRK